MENKPLDNQVWQWGDACYAKNQALCLMLQDSYAVNVNLLLLALYLDNTRTGVSADTSSKQTSSNLFSSKQWQILITGVMEWDDKLIVPYRRLRRLAKDRLSQTEYEQMLAVELMLERKAQRTILNAVNGLSPTGQQTNLVSYLTLFGLSAADVNALDFIAP
ncbi:DUF2390 domain-containing protein [Shewanella acanthi]|uniref:DUF2390 domain-containing protein n=1 Tax=Shewanella acanthi TaxID=2864212 RepID=UPI001C65DCCA|nr:DUF2390 domain-containing protein [Shewanella acanthi]QYJ78268.1 DUF2390 domain-containing protein [Shewanella acanthi]